MVFFKEAVEHITRAARVFRQPGGHMVLVSLRTSSVAEWLERLPRVREARVRFPTESHGFHKFEIKLSFAS